MFIIITREKIEILLLLLIGQQQQPTMPPKKFKIINRPASPDDVNPEIILTRYLYIKQEVLVSLTFAILEKRRDEALFWGYELYYSGFDLEVIEFVGAMYRDMFQLKNPRLEKFMTSQTEMWQKDHSEVILGTLIVNLLSREFEVDWFVLNGKPEPYNPPIKDHKLYVVLTESDIEKYKSIVFPVSPRFTLPKACIYKTLKTANKVFGVSHKGLDAKTIHCMQCYNWLYYASFSPIWLTRINEHWGTINHTDKTVTFSDDDNQDEFYDLYGYEPDEQLREVQDRFTHLMDYNQMSVQEFCRRFGARSDTIDMFSLTDEINAMSVVN
jgi:hypothetical protein